MNHKRLFFFGQPARAGINDPENGTYGIVYINMNRSASIGRSNFGAWPVCLLVLNVSPLDCLGPASAGLFKGFHIQNQGSDP